MSKARVVRSAVSWLKPVEVYSDGALSTPTQLNADLERQSLYITAAAQRLWTQHSAVIEPAVAVTASIRYKQRFLRDLGIDTGLPRLPGILTGNYRELVEHKLLSEAETWIRNPNPHKQRFSFNRNVDLSATNGQLSSVELGSNTILVKLRAMEVHYSLVFALPSYLQRRALKRISKPRVRYVRANEYVFDFTIEEAVEPHHGKLYAGVDLGKVEPYTAVVVSARGGAAAQYTASRGLKTLWAKKERLSEHLGWLSSKIAKRETLGLDSSALKEELSRVRSKRTRLHSTLAQIQAAELSRKLATQPVAEVRVENLKWLAGSKGVAGRGGKWSYGLQQKALEHALARRGIKQKAYSPKNSSQTCSSCGAAIAHGVQRTVWCAVCKTKLDRDFNAALNMATLRHLKSKKQLAALSGGGESESTGAELTADLGQPEVRVSCALVQFF